jgi:hypothetical protein
MTFQAIVAAQADWRVLTMAVGIHFGSEGDANVIF